MNTLLVIFGITGDLSTRKLLPALAAIVTEHPELDLEILGVSRRQVDVRELVMGATSSQELVDRTDVLTFDITAPDQYHVLKERIAQQPRGQTLMYLSVPPGASADIVDFLGQAGLNTPDIHLLFEKPFGFDTASAQDFIGRTGRYFDESQLYRIDHYMAKEVAAQVVRRKTSAERPTTGAKTTATKIEIIAAETVSIEGRAVFYEQTGALRDFLQGHLLQLLSLVLMDTSGDFSLHSLPERRMRALRQLLPADPLLSERGQYAGYDKEANNLGSRVETYASVRLASSDPYWQGVPLTIVTGKNLAQKQTAIVISYQDGSQLVIDEATVKPQDVRLPDAYERVLLGAIHDDRYLFTTSVEILQAWRILAPVQQAWAMETRPLTIYEPGSPLTAVRRLTAAD